MNGHRTINNIISWKAAERKNWNPHLCSTTAEANRGEALWRVTEESPGPAALKASEWEGAQPLRWPSLKGKKRSEIPFVCLQYLFPGFYQGCSFPGEYFFVAEVRAREAQDSRVEGLQAWLRRVGAWNEVAQLQQGWKLLALIRVFLHFLLRAVSVCQTRALPSCIILRQSKSSSLLCKKPPLLIIQEHVSLPMFHAALPSGPAMLYAAW